MTQVMKRRWPMLSISASLVWNYFCSTCCGTAINPSTISVRSLSLTRAVCLYCFLCFTNTSQPCPQVLKTSNKTIWIKLAAASAGISLSLRGNVVPQATMYRESLNPKREKRARPSNTVLSNLWRPTLTNHWISVLWTRKYLKLNSGRGQSQHAKRAVKTVIARMMAENAQLLCWIWT